MDNISGNKIGINDIEENIIYLFTDGASRKVYNEIKKKRIGRFGGEGIRIVYIDKKFRTIEKDISDYISYKQFTNQDMELKAVVDGLKYILYNNICDYKKIIVVSDADYIVSNWKYAIYKRPRNGRKDSFGVGLIHKKLWKEFNKLHKLLYSEGYSFDCKRIKGHNDNKYNELADKSAVKGAQSKIRHKPEGRRSIRSPMLKCIKFDTRIGIEGEKGLLIHVTNSVGNLGKNRKRYICEIVDHNHEFFRYRFYIRTNKALSSEFIYKVNLREDKSHIIDEVTEIIQKDTIIEEIRKLGLDENIFYNKK